MTVHAGAKATPGAGPDTSDAGAGSDTFDKAEFEKKLAELGLQGLHAYVAVKPRKGKLSRRLKRSDSIERGVEMPEVEEAKNTVYAVAKTIETDKDDAKRSARPSCRSCRVPRCSSS